jgi:branched-chain amino acid transport system permease protein
VIVVDILITGLMLGGLYALVAIGFNFQYGVARIMNLSYGEGFMLAAFLTFVLFTLYHVSPLITVLIAAPAGFLISLAIYYLILAPLVRRAKDQDVLERDSILVTFGLLFVIEGAALWVWGSQPRGYTYLAIPIQLGDLTVAVNRLLSFGAACVLGAGMWLFLLRTRTGTALRAIAVDPVAAELVAIDVRRYSAFAFATGGALIAVSGVLISAYLSFDPSSGVQFTLIALIVVILGGLGHMGGALVAGVILGLAEATTARLIDSELTLAVNYAIFLLILIVRPTGLFGRA